MIRKLTQALALTAAAAAAAAPAATAMPAAPDPAPAGSADSAPPQIVRSVQPGGFDLGDAAIGAGAVLTVLLAGAGGTLVARRARRPQFTPAQRA